jgi:nicotinamidase-related amidase
MRRYSGFEIGEGLADYCRPDRMALVVYDMQVGIVGQVKGADETLQRVKQVLDAARVGGFRIIFMRHMSMPKELMGAFQFRQAMVWQRTADPEAVSPWFLRGSPGFEIAPELEPRPSEAILDKITFSAFEGTPLAMILRDCGLTSFAICGIATEIGIDPTVRQGADLGLVPVVIRDACGCGHQEASERSMANMAFMGDALMTHSAEIIPMLMTK